MWGEKELLSSIMWSHGAITFSQSQPCWRAILEYFTLILLWNGASNEITASLMGWLPLTNHFFKPATCHSRFSCRDAALELFQRPSLSWQRRCISSLFLCSLLVSKWLKAPREQWAARSPTLWTADDSQSRERWGRGHGRKPRRRSVLPDGRAALSVSSSSLSAAINNILPFIPESVELLGTPDPAHMTWPFTFHLLESWSVSPP